MLKPLLNPAENPVGNFRMLIKEPLFTTFSTKTFRAKQQIAIFTKSCYHRFQQTVDKTAFGMENKPLAGGKHCE